MECLYSSVLISLRISLSSKEGPCGHFPPTNLAALVVLRSFGYRISPRLVLSPGPCSGKGDTGLFFFLGSFFLQTIFSRTRKVYFYFLKISHCQTGNWLLCHYCILPHSCIYFTKVFKCSRLRIWKSQFLFLPRKCSSF